MALLFVACYSVMISCEPDVASLTWDPIDYPQTLDHMANPTGHLANGSPEETLEMLAAEVGVSPDELGLVFEDYRTIHEQLSELLGFLGDSDGGQSLEDMEDIQDFEEDVTGTSAYVRILCSGPDQPSSSPDPEYGEIRIDDPSLSVQDVMDNGYVPDGQLLLDFKTCRGDDLTITGQNPSYASDYYDNLLLEMHVTLIPDDRNSYTLSNYSLFSSKAITILIEISGEGTYSFSLAVTEGLSFIFSTADGDFICTLGGDNFFQCGVTVRSLSI
jgi:hypothetical protein